jgi:hypothetical protein
MRYVINNRTIKYDCANATEKGPRKIAIHNAIDLTANSPWHAQGYCIEPLFDQNHFRSFKENTARLLISLWRDAGLQVPDSFPLDQYHTLIASQEQHLKAIDKTKLLPMDQFPFEPSLLIDRVSKICNCELEAINPFDGQRIFHFRIIRPNSKDNNPLHRDVWLEDYKDCINLYIPVTGSNELSSLILAPESHRWLESRIERTVGGAQIGTTCFNVPAVTHIEGDYTLVRPDPAENEVLVFSPYLIHGGSMNFNVNMTRISFEVRLWRKSNT